jgi:hypothetical protein
MHRHQSEACAHYALAECSDANADTRPWRSPELTRVCSREWTRPHAVDTNRYSIPERFVGQSVAVYKYPADILGQAPILALESTLSKIKCFQRHLPANY